MTYFVFSSYDPLCFCSNLFTQQIGGAQGSSAGAGIFRTRERHMLGMPPLEQQIYGGAGRGPEQEPEQLGNPNVMDEVNDMLNYDLIDDLLDFTAAEIESEPFLFDHHTAPKIDEIQVNSTVLPTVDIDPHTLEIPPLENSFRQVNRRWLLHTLFFLSFLEWKKVKKLAFRCFFMNEIRVFFPSATI